MLLDLVNRISSERKVKKNLDIQVWVLSRSSRGRPENVLGTSRINLPGTSLERQIKTSPGRHFRTSPGRSNRIFRGRPGDVGGGRPRDVLGTNICRLGIGGVGKSMSFSSFTGCWEIGVSSMIVLFCNDWMFVFEGCESFWFLMVVSGG